MASIFSHSILAFTIGKLYFRRKDVFLIILIGVICSCLPDTDVIMRRFGFHYGHMMGHRGFFHSIPFAFAFTLLVSLVVFRKMKCFSKEWTFVWIYLLICMSSHGALDAMTTGGKGVAFFAPFSAERYFFPWRPILVSPMSAGAFFSEWGWRVLKSEFVIVMLPCFLLLILQLIARKIKHSGAKQ